MMIFVSLLLALLWNASIAFAQGNEDPCSSEPPAVQEESGSPSDPYKVETLCQLQDIHSSLTAHYELVANIDASPTDTWNEGVGFIPIAFGTEDGFSGSLVNSSNYVITNLTINHPSTNSGPVGLFSRLATGATIRNVIMMGSRTTGYNIVGALVGENRGTIKNSSVTGSVFGKDNVGGLVGNNYGNISNSHSENTVTGKDTIGGLSGDSEGNISNSYATGSVSGDNRVGGLVGDSHNNISNSYATGSVSGNSMIGGLVGDNDNNISNSYATGSVSGNSMIGGLVGINHVSIINSYATGSVSGDNMIGGLVGNNYRTINYSYATASVSGNTEVGGLVGAVSIYSYSSEIVNSYYYRAPNNGLGTKRTNLRCPTQQQAICPEASTVIYEDWNTDVWDFGTVTELPQLSSNRNPDLNLKPYIVGPVERKVAADAVRTTEALSFAPDYPGPDDHVTLTWTLSSEVPGELDGLVYFVLPDGSADRKEVRGDATVQLVVTLNAGKNFQLVVTNGVSANDDRVQVQILPALPPTVEGGDTQTWTVWEETTSTTLTFEVSDQGTSIENDLAWKIVSSEIEEIPGASATLIGSGTGTVVEVLVTRRPGPQDPGKFTLTVTNSLDLARTVTVRVRTRPCRGDGKDLKTRQDEDGTSANPYQIMTLCQLQDISSSPSAHYELAAKIDATPTRTWNDGAGLNPIAASAGFSGSFVNSSNYVITGLRINRPNTDNVGLFSRLSEEATIRGVILMDSRTTGRNNVGSLVGSGFGVIEDSHSTGWVLGNENVGGLVGINDDAGRISKSSAANTVSGYMNVGGLVGYNYEEGEITRSYATGAVSGNGYVGGLVGMSNSEMNINNNYATGAVSGNEYIGGLVGYNTFRDVRNSYATGAVSGNEYIGGLVGYSRYGDVRNSYATGAVSGNEYIGGLVGGNRYGDVRNNYATGAVSGNEYIGGLVGGNRYGDVRNSYATGAISGNEYVGGLVGGNRYGNINDSYYARGRNNGLGDQRTWAQMRCQTRRETICPQDGTVTYGQWDRNVWDFGNSTDLPQLLFNPNPDLNLKPYIAGPAEQIVWIGAVPDTTALDFMAAYSGPDGAAPLTWTLAELSDEWADFVRFDLAAEGRTGTTASAATARLLVKHSMGRTLGESFQVVVRNHVSANDDRVWVRLMAALPPVIGGNSNQIRTVWEGESSGLLIFTASDPRSSEEILTWRLDSSGIAEGSNAVLVGSPTGTIATVRVTFSPGIVDLGSFTLGVKNSLGVVASSVTVSVETMPCRGGGGDLMAGQNGRGTINRPYRIETLCQLQDTNSNLAAHYALVADIDARPASAWNDGAGFEPIAFNTAAGFSASFVNSSNYVITGLTINRLNANSSPVGLFSRLTETAEVRGVILKNSRLAGHDKVGSLAGENGGTIEHCSATGSVSGSQNVGGLVGDNIFSGNIGKSYATEIVSGGQNIGGLVGRNSGHIRDSYAARSTVTGTGSAIGGLVGENVEHIIRSYASSTITAMISEVQDVGGLVGRDDGRINASYYYQNPHNRLRERRTLTQMICPTTGTATCGTKEGDPTDPTYNGWKTNVWNFGGDSDLPKLRSYTATRLDQWLRMRVHLGGAAR